MSPGDQLDEWLRREPPVSIVAFCAKCGGWTMFVSSDSENARPWIQSCYVQGDLIIPVRSADSMGVACPASWDQTECKPDSEVRDADAA